MKDGVYTLSFTTPLARALSVAGHPFVLTPLTIAATTRSLFWASVVAASTTIPMLLVILRNVRSGRWSDVDVSRHDQRAGLYFAGLPLLAGAALILYVLGASPPLMRGLAAGAAMFAAGLIGNRWLKISLHMMFAGFCAVTLYRSFPSPATALALLACVAALAWSRHHLNRHTWIEIAVGLAIGATSSLAAS